MKIRKFIFLQICLVNLICSQNTQENTIVDKNENTNIVSKENLNDSIQNENVQNSQENVSQQSNINQSFQNVERFLKQQKKKKNSLKNNKTIKHSSKKLNKKKNIKKKLKHQERKLNKKKVLKNHQKKSNKKKVVKQKNSRRLKKRSKKRRKKRGKRKGKKSRRRRAKPFKVDLDELIDYEFPSLSQSGIKFSKDMHDSMINYFQITFSSDSPVSSDDKSLRKKISGFLLIKSPNEEITINQFSIDGTMTKNMFKVKYINKARQKTKEYYFLIDYGNNETAITPYDAAKIIEIQQDEYYMKNYKFTLQKDCDTAEIDMGDQFKTFVCNQKIDDLGFFIPGVYDVLATDYEDNIINQQIVCINKEVEKPADMEIKEPNSGITFQKSVSKEDLINKVWQKIDASSKNIPAPLYNIYKNDMIVQDKVRNIVKAVYSYKEEILFDSQLVEEKYQEKLREETDLILVENFEREEAFQKTSKMLEGITNQINQFMLNLLVEKEFHQQNFDRDYELYFGKVELENQENELQQSMIDLDYENYLADKNIDDNYVKKIKIPGAN